MSTQDAATVTLREITADTLRAVIDLKVSDAQKDFVAENSISIAQAHFASEAWFRAIYADDEPVGFVMLSDKPDVPEYYLWRLMIDQRHQRKGYGRRAMQLIIEHVRARPSATEFWTSVIQEEGGPQPFYESLGFVATGEYDGQEALMRLIL